MLVQETRCLWNDLALLCILARRRCIMIRPVIEIIAAGGCYWRARDDRYGTSIVIPTRTPFKIAMDGPRSEAYTDGECRDGCWIVRSAEGGEASYASANEAVTSVRGQSSNAFLHVRFGIRRSWPKADDLRTDPAFAPDPVEELALQQAIATVRARVHSRKLQATEPDILRLAAKYVQYNPGLLKEAEVEINVLRPAADALIAQHPGLRLNSVRRR
jgi:hypothetical protein